MTDTTLPSALAQRVQLGALFAQLAYKPENAPPAGWTLVRKLDGRGTGFDAAVFRNDVTRELHVAVAGTNEKGDVARWPSAITGYSGNQAQIDVAMAGFSLVRDMALADKVGVSISGHSLAGQFVDLGAGLFNWQGTKFDAVGARAVFQSDEFVARYGPMAPTPDIVSCNVAGVGIFGGGIVGNIGGQDLAGTQS